MFLIVRVSTDPSQSQEQVDRVGFSSGGLNIVTLPGFSGTHTLIPSMGRFVYLPT